jgi:hypothetical protein
VPSGSAECNETVELDHFGDVTLPFIARRFLAGGASRG